MANAVEALYRRVIDDVVNSVRVEFSTEGVDEQHLQQLRKLWLTKLQATNALGSGQVGGGSAGGAAGGSSSSSMPTYASSGSHPPSAAATAAAVAAARGRHIPQTDGQHDDDVEAHDDMINHNNNNNNNNNTYTSSSASTAAATGSAGGSSSSRTVKHQPRVVFVREATMQLPALPQFDGPKDKDDEDDDFEDDQDGGSGEEIGGSDLDDDDAELETQDLILAQYEKVSRVKSKWKCVLRDGVMNLGGRDHVFSRATGEFDFA